MNTTTKGPTTADRAAGLMLNADVALNGYHGDERAQRAVLGQLVKDLIDLLAEGS